MVGDTNDTNADVYDILYAPFWPPEKTRQEVALMTKYLPPGGSVLDLGCGTGRHLVPLARRGYRVTGVDRSEGMIAVTKHKLRESKLAATVRHGDIAETDLGSDHDLVISMWNGIAELTAPEGSEAMVLGRMHEALRPGGHVMIQQSNPQTFDWSPSYDYAVEANDGIYTVRWRVVENDGFVSKAQEHVSIEPFEGESEERTTILVQRWHKSDEFERLLTAAGFVDIAFLRPDGTSFQEGDEDFIVTAKRE